MSMPSSDAEDTETAPEPSAESWAFLSLIDHDGVEPPATLTDRQAEATWCAVSAVWHPALLALAKTLPTIEGVEYPAPAALREVRLVTQGMTGRLPSGYREGAETVGAFVVEGGTDRLAVVADLLGTFAPEMPTDEASGAIVADFLALGSMVWWLRDLTKAMGHADMLDLENLTREVLAGARAWSTGDASTARNRLRAAFELLTQARERFYPVDAYLIDLCLIDPAMPGGILNDPLDARAPVTFLAPARAIENQATLDPESVVRLRESISEGWADVAGGAFGESDEPLAPLGSILWQFQQGGKIYREHLDGRNVETVARRRFGLYPMLPQIAKRNGFRFAIHLGFDAGRFPIRTEAKRLWAGPDHSSLEALTRPPIAADRPISGVMLPWRLGASMRDDHVATLPMVHWPAPLSGWFVDLRRVAAFSPVLARWVTLNDYFHLTDRPYETFTPEADEYVTPYLTQAVARKDTRPISGRARHARLRARFDAISTLRASAEGLGTAPGSTGVPGLAAIEAMIETGSLDDSAAELEIQETLWAGAVAQGIVGSTTTGRPGYLVINPLGVARRAAVLLREAAADLRPEGPLRAAQFTAEGVWAVVDLPAFGYSWIPRESNAETASGTTGTLAVRDKRLTNESIALEIDPATGGLRSVRTPTEETARIGQQLVIVGLKGADGAPFASRMRGESFEVDYGGPALAQSMTTGAILGPDDRRLATFRQQIRLWAGRPSLELEVTLSDLDSEWLASIADADPWSHYLACRWAWPDPTSMLRRSCILAPELTEVDRPETPDLIDISTRRQRTALLFGGLAHHRRHGGRMLDTLLIAGRETSNRFQLGLALDLEHPFHASAEMLAPAYAIATEAGPPRTGPTGWLYRIDQPGIAVTTVNPVEPSEDGRGWGLAFTMLETTGRASRCRLRTFRAPTWARQVDFQGEVIVDLPVEGDSVLVDFTPRELARVEVTFG